MFGVRRWLLVDEVAGERRKKGWFEERAGETQGEHLF